MTHATHTTFHYIAPHPTEYTAREKKTYIQIHVQPNVLWYENCYCTNEYDTTKWYEINIWHKTTPMFLTYNVQSYFLHFSKPRCLEAWYIPVIGAHMHLAMYTIILRLLWCVCTFWYTHAKPNSLCVSLKIKQARTHLHPFYFSLTVKHTHASSLYTSPSSLTCTPSISHIPISACLTI